MGIIESLGVCGEVVPIGEINRSNIFDELIAKLKGLEVSSEKNCWLMGGKGDIAFAGCKTDGLGWIDDPG